MSKASRRSSRSSALPSGGRSQPSTPGAARTGSPGAARGGAAGPTSGGSSGSSGRARAGRREHERLRAGVERSRIDRYRRPLVILVGAGLLLAFAFAFYSQATAASYSCDTLLSAVPSPSVVAGATPTLGQVEADMGQTHVKPGPTQHYAACPPASGPHYASPDGPVAAGYYAPGDSIPPEGWLHNLEHGGVVIAYSCTKGSCDDATTQQLQALLDGWPASPICAVQPLTNASVPTPIVVRFDSMSTRFAAIVWDRVLLLDTLDKSQILAFYQQWGDRTNPERANCALPSARPSTPPSASPSSAAPPSAAASPSAAQSPSASSPAASSPAASASPSPS